MNRAYALASLPVLSLIATGCGADPLIGDWALSNLTIAGESYTIPFVYTYNGDGGSYTYTTDISLSITEEMAATMTTTSSYTGPEGSESETDTAALTVTVVEKRSYTLAGTLFDEALALDCTIPEENLSCTGTLGEGTLSLAAAKVEAD